MKTLKRSIALALSVILLLSACITAHAAYTPKYTDQAQALYELGLFKGTGTKADGTPIFALEQKATRIQGLVMLLRLLGKEAQALAYTGQNPFTDVPDWAAPYAAYAYANGITKGTGATTFGSNDALLGKAYVTFVLRALGYDDAAGDFSYNEALTKGQELGLLAAGECAGDIYRDDCAKISYNALKTSVKGQSTTLMDKLVADGVLSRMASSSFYTDTVEIPVEVERDPKNYYKHTLTFQNSDILAAVPDAAWLGNAGRGGVTAAGFATGKVDLLNVFLNCRDLMDYCNSGKRISRPGMKEGGTHCVTVTGASNISTLTLMSEDYELVGYCIVGPDFSGCPEGTLTFTTCRYNGKADVQALRSALGKVTKVNNSAFYVEVVTKVVDGQEQTEKYLRVDESKLPEAVRGFVRYGIAHGADMDALLRCYSGYHWNSKPFGQPDAQLGLRYGSGAGLYLYNEAMDVIGLAAVPEEFVVVETTAE